MSPIIHEFALEYRDLVMTIMNIGEIDENRRTHSKIAFLPDGYSFSIDLSNNVLPTCGIRKTRPHIAAAETAWCFSGLMAIGWLKKHTSIWNQFADDNGSVNEAYGYRWRYAFDIDQIDEAICRLKRDPSDRRIWISSWDPRRDIVDRNQKTVPCPVGFTLSCFQGRLNSSIMIRSSDVFIGLPLDVMRHALVMRAIANSLEMQLGHMRVTLAHPHIYERQWEMSREMLEQSLEVPNLLMPLMPWTVDHVAENPDEYVTLIRNSATFFDWPEYDPKVIVVK